ncbi:hypothetical protein LCGC14_0368990 [marine sediment metagenome]|uniref:PEP-CTERM protein-sorting domain-containing protein n=1 Tax=marine sediment metagenome TaxID=412755 RepID=A0A0F9TNU5_9ZZZZ|nr:PEP-CTERM sorting domain-containing protein [Phycisphaerae bacterium]HDZ43076.1 PEP-CTERM sorting domain-containing protein [Phycisphaerae bacterium]
MKRQLLTLLVLATLAIAGGAALGASPGTIVLAEDPTFLGDGADFPGMWEYVYDVYGDASPVDRVTLSGFDASAIENQWPWSGWGRTGSLRQKWDFHVAHEPVYYERYAYGSYAVGGTGPWILEGNDWSMDNPWHAPSEYVADGPFPAFMWAGKVADDGESLAFISNAQNRVVEGLLLTFRIVHPYAPGPINWTLLSLRRVGQSNGTVLGPAILATTPGDYDDDGDVDADDVDLLRANMGGDPATYDADGDGDVDEDDMIWHVENLVELTDGSGRLGTRRGDFNLDGFVDGTDLALMKTAFGQPGMGYADGNANPDLFVDGTDLAILKTNFGFIADPAVPEPVTIGLLALGGLALLRRRA